MTDILITHYKEPQCMVERLLDSIALQQNVDFKEISVYVYSDGGNYLSLQNRYPFRLQYWWGHNEGISYARNTLFDVSNGEYVIFCDCDDLFNSSIALMTIEKSKPFDLFYSCYIEETFDHEMVLKEKDQTMIHGKCYRREFLKNNGIKFQNDTRTHEDTYFNLVAFQMAKSKMYSGHPIYLWKWNKDSVSRADNFMSKTFSYFIDSNEYGIRYFMERGMEKEARQVAFGCLYDTWIRLNTDEFQKNKDGYDKTVERITEFFKKYGEMAESATIEEKSVISKTKRDVYFDGGMYADVFSYTQFLKMLSE